LLSFLVCLWLTISLIADFKIKTSDFIRHKGVILTIDSVVTRVKDKPLFKQTTQELRLTINTEQEYFTSTTTTGFGDITSKIKTGDTVTIFTKPKTIMIFGLKKANDISHLVKDDKTIVDYEEYRATTKKMMILLAIPTIVIAIIYYVRTKKRFSVLISENI